MLETIENIGPILGLGLIGFFSTKMGFFPQNAAQALSRFVFDFAVPILLFRTFVTTQLPANYPISLFASFYLCLTFQYFIGFMVSWKLYQRPPAGAIIAGFSSAFGNGVLLGIPLMLMIFGPEKSWPFFALLSIHGLILFTLTTILLEGTRSQGGSRIKILYQIGENILKNPILMAIILGLIFRFSQWRLWAPVDKIAEMMQQAAAPCALFALGAGLTRYGFAGHFRQTMTIVAIKMLLFPALVYFVGHGLFQLSDHFVAILILFAALPTGVNAFLFAERYKTAQALSTSVVFISTSCALVTIPVVIAYILPGL